MGYRRFYAEVLRVVAIAAHHIYRSHDVALLVGALVSQVSGHQVSQAVDLHKAQWAVAG